MSIIEKKPNIRELMERVSDTRKPLAERERDMLGLIGACSERVFRAIPVAKRERAVMVAFNAIRKNPKLLDCHPISTLNAIGEAATYDWEIGGVLSHAYLVPYKDECKLIPGYKGLIDLCRRSGCVSTITLEVVHDGDAFDYQLGDDAKIVHKPAADAKRSERPITHVYAVVKLRDGGIQRSVWTAAAIDAHKVQFSQAWHRGEAYRLDCERTKKPVNEQRLSPWHTSWRPQALKTVIRDMIGRGLIPLSAEHKDIIERGQDDGRTLDAVGYEPMPSFQPAKIEDLTPETVIDAAPAKPAGDWESYLQALEATEMVLDAGRVYDAYFGPEATAQWTPEQEKLAVELRDKHCEAIKAKRGGKK